MNTYTLTYLRQLISKEKSYIQNKYYFPKNFPGNTGNSYPGFPFKTPTVYR